MHRRLKCEVIFERTLIEKLTKKQLVSALIRGQFVFFFYLMVLNSFRYKMEVPILLNYGISSGHGNYGVFKPDTTCNIWIASSMPILPSPLTSPLCIGAVGVVPLII